MLENCLWAVGQNPDTVVLLATGTTRTTTSTTTTVFGCACPHFSVPTRNARRVRLLRRGEKWRDFVLAALLALPKPGK